MKKVKEITCCKCGQQIFPISDSWEEFGVEKQHVTCPAPPALADVPFVQTDDRQGNLDKSMTNTKLTIPDFLTLSEVAKKLRLSESSVRRYVRQGDLKAKRLPGRTGQGTLLFDAKDVLALLEDV